MVARAEADVAFESGRHVHAARLWGRIRAPEPSFEEIALRFVGVGATEALQAFLMARLQVLGADDKAQVGTTCRHNIELHHVTMFWSFCCLEDAFDQPKRGSTGRLQWGECGGRQQWWRHG